MYVHVQTNGRCWYLSRVATGTNYHRGHVMKIMKKNKIYHCFPMDTTGAYEVTHLMVLNIYKRPNRIVVYVFYMYMSMY